MVDYSRKIISIPGEPIDLDYNTLGELRNIINNLIEKYGPDTVVKKVENKYDDHYNYFVMYDRPETDKEMNERVNKEIENEKRREDLEREEFERLKKKFNAGK